MCVFEAQFDVGEGIMAIEVLRSLLLELPTGKVSILTESMISDASGLRLVTATQLLLQDFTVRNHFFRLGMHGSPRK